MSHAPPPCIETPRRLKSAEIINQSPFWSPFCPDLRKTDSLEVKVRALLAERRQRIGYEKQLKAALVACR
ncbi:hypothetical protein [Pseudomonas sp. S31]|uniref:hypothetical protein n=1 Tax=Pseudomonas sp. S31 TaxID=1564473 RepID=UPI003FA68F9B